MRFIFTLLLLGYVSTSVAQSIDIDNVEFDLDCYVWNEDFELSSFGDLETLDYSLLSELDQRLMDQDLFISNCFIFKETNLNRNMITLRFTNGIERVYFVKRQKPLVIENVFDYGILPKLPQN